MVMPQQRIRPIKCSHISLNSEFPALLPVRRKERREGGACVHAAAPNYFRCRHFLFVKEVFNDAKTVCLPIWDASVMG